MLRGCQSWWKKVTSTSWQTKTASGKGDLYQNDCSPNCAAGHFHTYAAKVMLSDALKTKRYGGLPQPSTERPRTYRPRCCTRRFLTDRMCAMSRDRAVPLREPPAELEIRTESPADHQAVSAVVAAAFGSPVEARLVESIRASPEFLPELSLVGDFEGQIVGHVMISYAAIRDGEKDKPIALLAPLAVSPEFQRRGVGSALVREVTRRADDLDEPLVVLEGSPVFYGRLGFEYSVPCGIHLKLPSWAPAEASQILRLTNYTASIRGLVVYPAAFDEATGE